MSLVPVKRAQQSDCTLSAKEQEMHVRNFGQLTATQPNCDCHIWVGIFFDGTNNNKQRDQENVRDPAQRSHTNVVVLHDAFKDKPEDGFFRFYMPGVGTAFPEIGEMGESDAGKGLGWGGESRIYWAMIQVLNAMHQIVFKGERLISPEKAGKDVKQQPLYDSTTTVMNHIGMDKYFLPYLNILKKKLKDNKPCLKQVNLSVFGFSRGAAQARAFCYFLNRLCEAPKTLAGVRLRFQFVGLFDTVASVGIAAPSGLYQGFGGYANGSMDIPVEVERCTHYTAGHESRAAFPLSSVRIHKINNYRSNCEETAYPGCHSNVGGGYDPGCQGKSPNSRTRLLSQVPLRHMYKEAQLYGVPLLPIDVMRKTSQGLGTVDDLALDPLAEELFNAYVDWARNNDQTIETVMETHLAYYWRWRLLLSGDRIKNLESFKLANAQDQEDLQASANDFARDARVASLKPKPNPAEQRLRAQDSANSEKREDYYAHLRAPPTKVFRFFDLMVHDSHASFYMVGPVTKADRAARIATAKAKAKNGDSLNPFEKKLLTATPDNFPLMADFDSKDIVAMENFQTRAVDKAVGTGTRREGGSLIRFRQIFDDSRSFGQRA